MPGVTPDIVEQEALELIDNIVPTRGYYMPPMVGLGGSAGTVGALINFFKAMPADSGMIFVVVMHLSATHDSMMPEVIGHVTDMPVTHAQNGEKVELNHVYVIPPGKHMVVIGDRLRLIELENERGKRVAVDLFFRSLADSYGPHASAIMLSGADGAQGIRRIKERGGLTIAQDLAEAEHPEMPKSAIETGMIDWVLETAQMPQRLLQYRGNEKRLKLPPEDIPASQPLPTSATDEGEAALRDILIFLRTRTGRDFSYYKRATILRRIARRMQVCDVDELSAYLTYIRVHPGESAALLQDLLISVTNFFRDRNVFDALENLVPKLFEGKTHNDSVRAWIPACATGEEAYSVAMLLLEHASKLELPPAIQVFACDLNDDAIRVARAGHYPDTICADVSEERLSRFFVKEHRGYRVRRELREMVLFATHDVLKDPPFSRMDLVSCRNLLIYLSRHAQQRAITTFHFALKPSGLLLLGSSEAVDDDSTLFKTLDKKHRIYAPVMTTKPSLPFAAIPGGLVRIVDAKVKTSRDLTTQAKADGNNPSSAPSLVSLSGLGAAWDRHALTELHYKLIERFAPPSLAVNSEQQIIHLSELAGNFLKLSGGEPSLNLLRVVHPDLRTELRSALFRAAESGEPVESSEVITTIGGQPCSVKMRVCPDYELMPGCMLVIFETSDPRREGSPAPDVVTSAASERAVRNLERELEQVKRELRQTVEQYDASTEELKAGNEELQAMNEELRSATEELETSREELQSINEELTTVNQEMKYKMEELARANSDLQNLMASTSVATVFLDRELVITRYTPNAAAIFNIIPSDIGRPLAHLKHSLNYSDLIAEAEQVLQTLVPMEREVNDGTRWYISRIQPYRTLEDQIAGVALTLVDVTERNRAVEALRDSEERLRLLIESAKDYAIFAIDGERRVVSWNSGAEDMFGYREKEIVGQSADVLFTPEDCSDGAPEQEVQVAHHKGRAESEHWYVRKSGALFYGSGSVMPLRDKTGEMRGYVKIMRDLTETKRVQEELHEQMEELTRFNSVAVGRESRMVELKKEINDLCAKLGEPPRYLAESEPMEKHPQE